MRRWLSDDIRTAVIAGIFSLVVALIGVWEHGRTKESASPAAAAVGGTLGRYSIDCALVDKRIFEFARTNPDLVRAELQADPTGALFRTIEERLACPASITPVLDLALRDAKP